MIKCATVQLLTVILRLLQGQARWRLLDHNCIWKPLQNPEELMPLLLGGL